MREPLMQAEATVVGAAMASRDTHAIVASRIAPDDLGHPPHRMLFQAAMACAEQGGFGAVAIADELMRQGPMRISEAGGMQVITQLAGRGHRMAPSDLDHRIGMVLSASTRRRLDRIGESIRELARDDDRDPATLVPDAMDLVMDAQGGTDERVGLFTVEDLYADVEHMHEAGQRPQGVSTGWVNVDRKYRPRKGRWTLVNGIPGHGKSTWLDALAVNLSKQHGWRFAICSPEKVPVSDHLIDLMTCWAGMPFYEGPHPRMSRDDLKIVRKEITDRFVWTLPSEQARSVPGVLAAAELAHRQQPIDGLIIDPWNELDHARPQGLSETEYISQQLTRIRVFARRNDVHVWLVAHPTKLHKGTDGKYPVPTPYDVSGSAHWRNKADNAVTVWRDHAEPGSTQLHVQKVRFQPQEGVEGRVDLAFVPWQNRFDDEV